MSGYGNTARTPARRIHLRSIFLYQLCWWTQQGMQENQPSRAGIPGTIWSIYVFSTAVEFCRRVATLPVHLLAVNLPSSRFNTTPSTGSVRVAFLKSCSVSQGYPANEGQECYPLIEGHQINPKNVILRSRDIKLPRFPWQICPPFEG